MKNFYFILLAILEPWVEYCSDNFLEIFCSTSFCRKRGQFSLLIASIVAPSGFGVRRAQLQHDVRKGTLNAASSIKQRASNNSGNLSLFCSVSSVDSEESEVPEAEGDLETVEPYQFEPVASDSSTESDTKAEDDDSGVEDRLRSRYW